MRTGSEAKVFNLTLAAIVLPIVSWPLVLGAAMWAKRRATITGSRVWERRFMALAVLDGFVAIALIGLLWFVPSPAQVGPREAPPPTTSATPGSQGLFTSLNPIEASECVEASMPVLGFDTSLIWMGLALVFALIAAWLGREHRAWRLLGAALGVFVLAAIVGDAARAGMCAACGGYSPGVLLVGLNVHGLALALGGLLLMRRVGDGPLLSDLPPLQVYAQSLYYAFVWVPRAAIVVWGLIGATMLFAQTHAPLDLFQQAELGVLGTALLMLGGAVIGPIAEELLFRGALLPFFARFMTPWRAIVLQGLLFGVLHTQHGISIVGPLVLGMILGWARARTGSVRIPILLHMTFNAASLTMLVLLT